MIRLEKKENKVAVLYLDNPPLNLVTLEMTQRLKEALHEVENDEDIKTLIITASGDKFFSVGSDLKEFGHVREQVVDLKLKEENIVFSEIEKLSKPVIIAMNGMTLGGGCELALAGDIRILAKNTEIGLPEIKLGVFPGSGGLYRLPKIIGMSKAMEMMYTGKAISSEEAYRIGLVNYIVDQDKVLSFAMKLAEDIAKNSKESLRIIKHGVRKSIEISQEEAIKYNLEMSDFIFKTKECEEGLNAFFEKREPLFD